MTSRSLAIAALLALVAGLAGADIRVHTIDDELTGEWTRIEDGHLFLRTGGAIRRLPVGEIVSIEAVDRGVVVDDRATEIRLTNGDVLRGTFEGGAPDDPDAVVLATVGLGRLEIRMVMIESIRMPAQENDPVAVGSHDGEEDVVYLRPRGDALAGTVNGFTRDEVRVLYKVTRDIVTRKLADVLRIELRSVMDAPDPKYVLGIIQTQDGCRVHARIDAMADGVLRARSVYENEMFLDGPIDFEIPVGRIDSITMKNGRFVYVSDLEPVEARSHPYFDEEWDHARDRSWAGTPLSVGGKTYQKGIGTHAHYVLTYRLEDDYDRFQSVVGIDDSVVETSPHTHGGVVFRVFADGKAVFDSGLVTRQTGPRKVDVELRGVRTIVLEADYGPNGPVNARADWAGAKLLR